LILRGPGDTVIDDVPSPIARAGQVVVNVDRVGVCGTDAEFFDGSMIYLKLGYASYPMRLGHEWCGVVSEVAAGVDEKWLGRRVTADTMLGCGDCRLCLKGRQHLCERRCEIGVRGGWPGALAEKLAVPLSALHRLPDTVDNVAGAMAEPGGNALRAAEATGARPGSRILVFGPGTIGLLAAQFAMACGAEVDVVGLKPESLDLARRLGVHTAWNAQELPHELYDAVIDATDSPSIPSAAIRAVEPGGRLVYIGLAGEPSPIDARDLVVKDLTAVGIRSASPGLGRAIELYAQGIVKPSRLVGAVVALEDVGRVLAGWRPADAGPGPKILVDPTMLSAAA
jgi:threonine dehydrogenase-like Zn-dependent dehydrogenase